MRKLPSFFRKFAKASQKGFTLIELLVVIGILGVLVSALVATINPFEQIKKGDDATLKNVAAEFQTAVLRYYTTHGGLPWDEAANGGDASCTADGAITPANDIITPVVLNSAGFNTCIDALQADKELKDGFEDFSKIGQLWVSEANSNVTVCFEPTSISQRKAPETKYDSAGAVKAGCPAANPTDASDCYFCAK